MNVIEVSGLNFRYGRQDALRGVDLAVPEGSVYALLGPNGAGKSTLMRILVGLQRASAGRATVLGADVRRLSFRDRMSIGYVAEGQRLPDGMTLGALEDYLAPLYPSWDHSLVDDLRARFRLDRKRTLSSLSRGEYMKASLLTSLAPRPRLLIMDEPFTGMDVAVRDELVRGVLLGAGPEGWTVVIASHDVGELESIADWVGFMDQGRVQFSRPVDELREEYRGVVTTPSLREIFLAAASGRGPQRPTEVAR